MKKITCSALICLVAVLAASCAKKPEAVPESTKAEVVTAETEAVVPETEAPETEAPETEEETVPETETIPETEAEAVTPLHIRLENVSKGKENCYDLYYRIGLSEEDAARYPVLEEAFKDHNRMADAESEKRIQQLFENYQEVAEGREEEIFTLNAEINTRVTRADSNAVSFFHFNYINLGGTHPDYRYTGDTFDVASGKRLLLTDVVTDPEAFFDLVDEKLQTEYADIYDYMNPFDEYRKNLAYNEYAFVDWSMDPVGLTVYFNPYELGPYAMGAQTVTVCYDEAPELFYEKFRETSENYAIPLTGVYPVKADVTGNGKLEDISVSEEPDDPEDEYCWQYDFIVHAGNRSVQAGGPSYSQNSYLLKANGQYYLYLFEASDNDYTILNRVDLKTMECDWEKSIGGSLRGFSGEYISTDDGYVSFSGYYPLTDPDQFFLSENCQILGTRGATAEFRADENGYPERVTPWFNVESTMCLQTKAEVSCQKVDVEGNVLEETMIPAGTYLAMVRTDGESWADFQIPEEGLVEPDGSEDFRIFYTEENVPFDEAKEIYRISCDTSQYPRLVNGIEETELFDGIAYAG